jgi:hypothetical protein
MKNLLLVLRWLFGVIFSCDVFIYTVQGFYICSFFFLIAAMICIPPVCTWVESKINYPLSRGGKYRLVIGSIIGAIAFIPYYVPELKNIKPEPPKKVETYEIAKGVSPETKLQPKISEKKIKPKEVLKPIEPQININQDSDNNNDGCYYSGRRLHTGRRGGCFYYNRNGNKTYVDRSFCRNCY